MRNLLLIWALFLVISISGCTETSSYNSAYTSDENKELPPTSTDTDEGFSFTQSTNINGNYKVQDISGRIIRINGNYNEIKIINKDVSETWINGQYNSVYYPKDASPLIKENGVGNEIQVY